MNRKKEVVKKVESSSNVRDSINSRKRSAKKRSAQEMENAKDVINQPDFKKAVTEQTYLHDRSNKAFEEHYKRVTSAIRYF